MLQKIKRFFAWVFILGLLGTIAVLGILFVIRNNEATELRKANESLDVQVKQLNEKIENAPDCGDIDCPSELEFVDSGQELSFTYPIDWKLTQAVKAGEIHTLDGELGAMMSQYTLSFTKNEAELVIDRAIDITQFTAQAFKVNTGEFEKLGGADAKFVRVQVGESEDWQYANLLAECPEEIAGMDVEFCYGLAAPFDGVGAYTVTLSGDFTEEELLQVDQIVLSAK